MRRTTFLSSALFAAGILAAARPEHGMGGGLQLSRNTTRIIKPRNPSIESLNWAGALLPSPPNGETFTDVIAQFTVPIAGAKGTSIAIWVGIDGVATDAPGIQGGIHVSVGDDGIASYETWTEWIPDLAVSYDQDTFSFKSGDVLNIAISSKGCEDIASLLIENETSGKQFSKDFSPSDSSNVAQGKTVEWVVERAPTTTLSNFGTFKFSDASAGTSGDTEVDLSGATVLSIKFPRDPILATGSINSPSEVKVIYSGL